ncbi:MAG: hypothetical protein RL689_2411, partial [Planctomycetota bacterium]
MIEQSRKLEPHVEVRPSSTGDSGGKGGDGLKDLRAPKGDFRDAGAREAAGRSGVSQAESVDKRGVSMDARPNRSADRVEGRKDSTDSGGKGGDGWKDLRAPQGRFREDAAREASTRTSDARADLADKKGTSGETRAERVPERRDGRVESGDRSKGQAWEQKGGSSDRLIDRGSRSPEARDQARVTEARDQARTTEARDQARVTEARDPARTREARDQARVTEARDQA